jgi:hypothetical protein
MPVLITRLLLAVFALYAVYLFLAGIVRRSAKTLWMEGLGLIGAFLLLNWTTGFPAAREPFSQTSSTAAILVMFTFVAIGMLASYFFYLKGPFELKSFLRPLLVSPIVLLPLIGTVESNSEIESMQLICLVVLAFQNGFFWRIVFEHAKPKTK